MAPSTPNTALADQLVASLLPIDTTAPKLRRLRDAFLRRTRIHNCARTNQFEVAERLDALQEKFQILNHDELADALRARLLKLQEQPEKWLPDVLDLMIRLSDDPANKAKPEWLDDAAVLPSVIPPLTWAQIEADDPIDRNDQIWRVSEYSDLSSDDDIVVLSANEHLTESTDAALEEHGGLLPKLEIIDTRAGQTALECLQDEQFWQNRRDEPFELSELQVIRELLFVLQGLPTALLWKVGCRYELDKRIRLQNASREVFSSMAHEFGEVAGRLDKMRDFVKEAPSTRYMQMLRSGLEATVQGIDSKLRALEEKLVALDSDATSTILQLLERVTWIVQVTRALASFLDSVGSQDRDNVRTLEILFDHTCQTQAHGDESGFQCLSILFSKCFEAYFQPVRDWMDYGLLPESQETLFISIASAHKKPSELWQKWYHLVEDPASNCCPKFLQFVQLPIFSVGKSIIFLNHLNTQAEGDGSLLNSSAPWELMCGNENPLMPFAELFSASIERSIRSRLGLATRKLQDELGNNCGLWKSLDALRYVYFARNGHVWSLVDTKIFTAIDRSDRNWNDRFVVGDLLRAVFRTSETVDVGRLTIRPSSTPSRNMARRRQSVKLLQDFRIEYMLPWHIANIVTKSSLATYQRISTFLTQIRRARYMLERRCLSQVRSGIPGAGLDERYITQLLHHDLLLFVNTLYDHITSLVIEEGEARLRHDLQSAADIDVMITAYKRHCKDLQDACLTSEKLKPIHEEMISVLDLCIRFSDLHSPTTKSRRSSDAAELDSYISAASHQHRRRQLERAADSSSDDEEADVAESDGDGEGLSTFVVPDKSTWLEQLRKVRADYDKHLSFIVAGLHSIGKAAEQGGTWEILGSRLRWERKRHTLSSLYG